MYHVQHVPHPTAVLKPHAPSRMYPMYHVIRYSSYMLRHVRTICTTSHRYSAYMRHHVCAQCTTPSWYSAHMLYHVCTICTTSSWYSAYMRPTSTYISYQIGYSTHPTSISYILTIYTTFYCWYSSYHHIIVSSQVPYKPPK